MSKSWPLLFHWNIVWFICQTAVLFTLEKYPNKSSLWLYCLDSVLPTTNCVKISLFLIRANKIKNTRSRVPVQSISGLWCGSVTVALKLFQCMLGYKKEKPKNWHLSHSSHFGTRTIIGFFLGWADPFCEQVYWLTQVSSGRKMSSTYIAHVQWTTCQIESVLSCCNQSCPSKLFFWQDCMHAFNAEK